MHASYDQPTFVLALTPVHGQGDALAHCLRSRWEEGPVELRNPDTGHMLFELYFASEVEALLLRSALMGETCLAAATITRTNPADWEAAFRSRFHARNVGERLRICPLWEQDQPGDPGRTTVLIDPGLSFGTGEHFTTSFCLEMIDQVWLNSAPSSFLDVGTGSGILAIAAARLGCPRIVAIEADTGVMSIARDNLARNGVGDRIDLRSQDLQEDPPGGVYDVVCANLFASLLTDCSGALRQATGTSLIMSGMREFEIDGVADVFARLGGREVVRDGDGEWAGLVIAFGSSDAKKKTERRGKTK